MGSSDTYGLEGLGIGGGPHDRVNISGSSAVLESHYPYDCPRVHCMLCAEDCSDDYCQRQLQLRKASLTSQLEKLYEIDGDNLKGLQILREDIESRWNVLPGFLTSPGITGIDTESGFCGLKELCVSCTVEDLYRKVRSYEVGTALQEKRLEELQAYYEQRSDDEDTRRVSISENETSPFVEEREQNATHITGLETMLGIPSEDRRGSLPMAFQPPASKQITAMLEYTRPQSPPSFPAPSSPSSSSFASSSPVQKSPAPTLTFSLERRRDPEAIEAKAQLDRERAEIQRLESQMLSMDIELGESFLARIGCTSEGAYFVHCDCAVCCESVTVDVVEEALSIADERKQWLRRQLGITDGGKTSKQVEQDRIKALVAQDSPFGRTGSYRGFGAGSLKLELYDKPEQRSHEDTEEAEEASFGTLSMSVVKESGTYVVNSQQRTTPAPHRQAFSWKAAKAKNRRFAAPILKPVCDGAHCELSADSCNDAGCKERQRKRLNVLTTATIALSLAFEQRLSDLDQLRLEIAENCNTGNLSSSDIDVSRTDLIDIQKKTVEATFCECVGCQLQDQQKEALLLNDRLAAAQHRLTLLREYRIANDEDTLQRSSSNFIKSSKYFTPIGSTKAKGVTALKPTLQMQSSYNVTALTTNSMAARPLKVVWRDKPKTVRIVDGSSKLDRR